MCGGNNKVGPTAEQQEAQTINQQMFDYYKTNYKPLIDKYAAQVTSPKETALENKKVTGQINADIMKHATPASATNPVVNANKMANLSSARAKAEVQGLAGEKERQIGKELNVIDIGKGQVTTAMQGLDEVAKESVDAAIRTKEADMEKQAQDENAIGSIVGLTAAMALGSPGKGKE